MMEADILLFMGQSNMAGRGDDQLAPKVLPGAAWEYRAVTEPDRLVPLAEPFGVNENREGGVWEPGMKTGSMAAAFVNACYRKDGTAGYRSVVFQGRFQHPGMAAGYSVF